jgi:hypothetical protein
VIEKEKVTEQVNLIKIYVYMNYHAENPLNSQYIFKKMKGIQVQNDTEDTL